MTKLQNFKIEEADSRLILHLSHAVQENFKSAFVLSCDTDVLILLLNYYEYFKSLGLQVIYVLKFKMKEKNSLKKFFFVYLQDLWDLTGNVKKENSCIPVHTVFEKLGAELCDCLIAIHHLTGSDYTSKIGTKHKALFANPTDFVKDFGEGKKNI